MGVDCDALKAEAVKRVKGAAGDGDKDAKKKKVRLGRSAACRRLPVAACARARNRR